MPVNLMNYLNLNFQPPMNKNKLKQILNKTKHSRQRIAIVRHTYELYLMMLRKVTKFCRQ